MSFTCSEKWLLVEWGNGVRGVVNSKYMVRRTNLKLKAGCNITIRRHGELQLATYIARSNDRQLLKQILGDEAGPSVPPEPDVGDFSPSSSDWKPSDDEESDSEVETKRPKLDVSRKPIRQKRNKKIIKPSNKVEPLIPNNSRKKQQTHMKTYINCRKRQHESTPKIHENNNNTQPLNDSVESSSHVTISLDMKLVIGILEAMNKIAQGLGILKEDSAQIKVSNNKTSTAEIINGNLAADEEDEESNHSDESNRSDDNVLISNKYRNIENNEQEPILDEQINSATNSNQRANDTQQQNMSNETVSTESENHTEEIVETVQNNTINKKLTKNTVKNTEKILSETQPQRENIDNNTQPQKVDNNTQSQKQRKPRGSELRDQNEWVPIGSGKTLVHKDKFRKVKWSSYTIATRTLLLALFPRRTLATHSLTGKRSPAFQDKPAKMCLDPKKITDIIIEVMDRFDVRENLVRSIITTKCADESKMFRTRMEKKRNAMAQHKNGPNQNGSNKENN